MNGKLLFCPSLFVIKTQNVDFYFAITVSLNFLNFLFGFGKGKKMVWRVRVLFCRQVTCGILGQTEDYLECMNF